MRPRWADAGAACRIEHVTRNGRSARMRRSVYHPSTVRSARRTGFIVRNRYFAFGANMSRAILVDRRRITPERSEPARLDGYRLVFTEPGIPLVEPAFASIEPAPGDHVHGVLHHLPDGAADSIDRFEGRTYDRIEVVVDTVESGRVGAWAYRSRRTVRCRRPSRRYLQLLIAGACEHGLPEEHIARLRHEPCVHVPVIGRAVPFLLSRWETAIGRSERMKALAHRLYDLLGERATRE